MTAQKIGGKFAIANPALGSDATPWRNGVISAADVAMIIADNGLTIEQLAVAMVEVAQQYAVVPVSSYPVGAVAIGLSGGLYFGANLEVAGQALSFTVHAEQASIANAWINGETGISSLAISAAPCGYCRQFLYELVDAARLNILIQSNRAQALTYYLPDPFGPGDLGITGGLMQPKANGLTVSQALTATGTAALAAANASYSPYTKTFSGVALRTSTGVICTGRYAENAAYNPSMSPLEAALSQLVLYDQTYDTIVEAVLIEANGLASQAGATQVVLASVTSTPLTVVQAQ